MRLLVRRISRHGLLGAVKLVPINLRWAWRRLQPANFAERRRERSVDRELGIETAALLTRGRLEAEWDSPKGPTGYQPIAKDIFEEMIGCLQIDIPSFSFIDIGSGKGRALALAARSGFPTLVGVELSPTLHRIAERNFSRIAGSLGASVRLLNIDAREFVFPGTPTVIFLYNPFTEEEIMRTVVANIECAHRPSGNPAFLLYHSPVLAGVLQERDAWREFATGRYRKDYNGLEWQAFTLVKPQRRQ